MMWFSGSHSEPIKKWREAAWSNKNTPREKPQGVFGVRCALLPARRLCSQPTLLASAAVRTRQSTQPRVRRCSRPSQPAATAGTACVTLVNTSVYLKPAKLINVAFDVLARLAPCLNLGVRELGHKDLLDTIGADNCRK